jgi:hypothetical protein
METLFNIVKRKVSKTKDKTIKVTKNNEKTNKLNKTKDKKKKTKIKKVKFNKKKKDKSKFDKDFKKNTFIDFINSNIVELKKGKILLGKNIDKYFFNESPLNCICENIYHKHLSETCKCKNLSTFDKQGKSGAIIHSIKCENNLGILKVIPLSEYYLKFRDEVLEFGNERTIFEEN